MRLVQSSNYKQMTHAAREKGAERTLCGYRINRSWRDHGPRWLKIPDYPHVACKHCRRVLGVMTGAEQTRRLGRAVSQLGEVVALAIETGTFKKLFGVPRQPQESVSPSREEDHPNE